MIFKGIFEVWADVPILKEYMKMNVLICELHWKKTLQLIGLRGL
jgi:hypothetical protein